MVRIAIMPTTTVILVLIVGKFLLILCLIDDDVDLTIKDWAQHLPDDLTLIQRASQVLALPIVKVMFHFLDCSNSVSHLSQRDLRMPCANLVSYGV